MNMNNFATKKKASASSINTFLQALSIAKHELKFTPTAPKMGGREDTNTSGLARVSKARSVAITDATGADETEDWTISFTCAHSGSNTSISSLGNEPQHCDKNVTDHSLCLNTSVQFRERTVLHVEHQVFYCISSWVTNVSAIKTLSDK